jgi:hypothetical protein
VYIACSAVAMPRIEPEQDPADLAVHQNTNHGAKERKKKVNKLIAVN